MYRTAKTAKRRDAFTLVEMLVVIAIILAIAALAAAFAPRVSDSQNLTRAVDNLEQWLLTAKMRAKRDRLATGVRFVQAPGDAAGIYSQIQYVQQPDSLSGIPNVATLVSAGNGTVTFSGVDFSLGGAVLAQPLVQFGDYLEVRDGGVYFISAASGPTTLQLNGTGYDTSLTIAAPGTSNYRILRQARILIGEEPLTLPNNFAVNFNTIPGTTSAGSNVALSPSYLYYEILFSPTGAVVGSNAGQGALFVTVYDQTMNPFDLNKVGIVAVQCRTGFIGAYSVYSAANPFYFAETGQESGL
ncbi:MAG TPA: prepilin-type N-terminal cleavage/methylation domain-containing protein [Gemmataceae bacterium]|nr:prepilin-type N-terminal cleavage/methylation domain-containing protein [Gemmataceae bacterium]